MMEVLLSLITLSIICCGGCSAYDSVCFLPRQNICGGIIPGLPQKRYYFDSDTQQCRMFSVFSGCESNGNNFESLESCESTCSNTPPTAHINTDATSLTTSQQETATVTQQGSNASETGSTTETASTASETGSTSETGGTASEIDSASEMTSEQIRSTRDTSATQESTTEIITRTVHISSTTDPVEYTPPRTSHARTTTAHGHRTTTTRGHRTTTYARTIQQEPSSEPELNRYAYISITIAVVVVLLVGTMLILSALALWRVIRLRLQNIKIMHKDEPVMLESFSSATPSSLNNTIPPNTVVTS